MSVTGQIVCAVLVGLVFLVRLTIALYQARQDARTVARRARGAQ
jgi:hypothetical protein